MGSPRQTFAGKHGSPGSAGGQGQPRDGVPPILRYIPAFWNSLAPASLPKQGRRRRRRRTQRSWDSLLPPRDISGPTPNPNPNAFPSVVDLSAAVFRYEPFKKTENFQEGDEDLKPSFLSEERNLPAVS